MKKGVPILWVIGRCDLRGIVARPKSQIFIFQCSSTRRFSLCQGFTDLEFLALLPDGIP